MSASVDSCPPPPPPPARYAEHLPSASTPTASANASGPSAAASGVPFPAAFETSTAAPPAVASTGVPAQGYYPYVPYSGYPPPPGVPAPGGPGAPSGTSAFPPGPYNPAPGYWGAPPQYSMPPEGAHAAPGYPPGAQYAYVTAPPFHPADAVHIGIPVDGAPAALKPAGTRVDVTRQDGVLTVTIPAKGLRSAAPNLVFVTVWLALIALGLAMMVLFSGPFFLIAFSIPFLVLGLWYLGDALRNSSLKETFKVENGQFFLTRDVFGWKSTVRGDCRNLLYLEIKIKRRGDRPELEPESWCSLLEGPREHTFGRLIKVSEQQWVLAEMSADLRVPVRIVQINTY